MTGGGKITQVEHHLIAGTRRRGALTLPKALNWARLIRLTIQSHLLPPSGFSNFYIEEVYAGCAKTTLRANPEEIGVYEFENHFVVHAEFSAFLNHCPYNFRNLLNT
jgi:hypothetical protein